MKLTSPQKRVLRSLRGEKAGRRFVHLLSGEVRPARSLARHGLVELANSEASPTGVSARLLAVGLPR